MTPRTKKEIVAGLKRRMGTPRREQTVSANVGAYPVPLGADSDLLRRQIPTQAPLKKKRRRK